MDEFQLFSRKTMPTISIPLIKGSALHITDLPHPITEEEMKKIKAILKAVPEAIENAYLQKPE